MKNTSLVMVAGLALFFSNVTLAQQTAEPLADRQVPDGIGLGAPVEPRRTLSENLAASSTSAADLAQTESQQKLDDLYIGIAGIKISSPDSIRRAVALDLKTDDDRKTLKLLESISSHQEEVILHTCGKPESATCAAAVRDGVVESLKLIDKMTPAQLERFRTILGSGNKVLGLVRTLNEMRQTLLTLERDELLKAEVASLIAELLLKAAQRSPWQSGERRFESKTGPATATALVKARVSPKPDGGLHAEGVYLSDVVVEHSPDATRALVEAARPN